MTEQLSDLTNAYASALKGYLEGAGEAALLKAYDVGRAAVAAKYSVLEMSAVHQVALVRTLLERLPRDERARIEDLAAGFSAESLLPFELTVRGAYEANAVLQHLTETLNEKNAEIQRQLEALRTLESLKDDLMSLLVHDLRNPLAGMISCLDLLKPRPGDPQYEPTLEIVTLAREGARKLSELLDDLLEVRKLEEGKVQVRRELVPVRDLLRDAIATLEPAARLEELAIEVELPDPALVIEADWKLLRRAVENLVSNAIKFAKRGTPIVVRASTEGDSALLEIMDRGPGIAPEVSEQLFQKFGAVEARTRGGRRGFGLGLYFVKLVATAHGGSVDVHAREGGGTTFRIRLPRTTAP